MELEKQCTSLELSRKLKELGFKQDSLYYWWVNKLSPLSKPQICSYGDNKPKETWLLYSAFTCSELGEMLPRQIGLTHPRDNHWKILYRESLQIKAGEIRNDTHSVEADTEVNARAKMLIYLTEQHLITPNE